MDGSVGTTLIRVLLVDDDPGWCSLLKAEFEQEGEIELVGVAHYASAALRLVSELGPDVVLMDLNLPDGYGSDLVRACMEVDSTARYLMLSSDESVEAVLESQQAGALGFVEKGGGYPAIRKAILVGR